MVSIVHAARDLGRLRDISTVLARHGFDEVVRRLGLGATRKADPAVTVSSDLTSTASRLRRALEDLGPSFVKLGQIMSTRADLLPPEIVAELTKLQDGVPAVAFAEIREQVERALGASLDELFATFDPVPLAAASIAQVHRATLQTADGPRQVVVKVQRPGIAQTVASDLDILHTFAALLERAIPESRIYSPTGLVRHFDRAITAELDFTAEAENARRFAENFAGSAQVRFPRVYPDASSKHVITLEYLDGKKVHDAIAAGHSGKRLVRLALEIIVQQIFEDGFFHADPHPGNVLILGDPDQPVIAMLDLGMVGRLSPRMRDLLVDLMIAAVRRDYDGIADATYALGSPTRKVDMHAYRAEVARLAEKYLGRQLKDIAFSSLLRDLVRAATTFGIEIPPEFLLAGKALMTLEGVGKEIDPELDVFEEARPLFLDMLKRRYSPERLGMEVLKRLEKLGEATYHVPQQLQEVLEDLRLGRLTIRTEDNLAARSNDRLGRRIYSGLVSGALILAGAWLTTGETKTIGLSLLATSVAWNLGHLLRDAYAGRSRR